MMKPVKSILPVVLLTSVLSLGCQTSENNKISQSVIQPLPSPAQSKSSVPNLFAGKDGKIYLSR
jgi:hypothetical protein